MTDVQATPRWAYGIYGIFNRHTGRVYVGQSGDIGYRWGQHRGNLRKGSHSNAALQADWNQYGPDGFEWRILERYDIDAGSIIEWNRTCADRERYWAKRYEVLY